MKTELKPTHVEKQVGYYHNSYSFMRAYYIPKDGSMADQVGSISSYCKQEQIDDWIDEMCGVIEQKLLLEYKTLMPVQSSGGQFTTLIPNPHYRSQPRKSKRKL